MVIRNKVNDLHKMKKSVWATLFHNCDISNEKERYLFAPAYVQVGVCVGQINLPPTEINIERNYLYYWPLNLC